MSSFFIFVVGVDVARKLHRSAAQGQAAVPGLFSRRVCWSPLMLTLHPPAPQRRGWWETRVLENRKLTKTPALPLRALALSSAPGIVGSGARFFPACLDSDAAGDGDWLSADDGVLMRGGEV